MYGTASGRRKRTLKVPPLGDAVHRVLEVRILVLVERSGGPDVRAALLLLINFVPFRVLIVGRHRIASATLPIRGQRHL